MLAVGCYCCCSAAAVTVCSLLLLKITAARLIAFDCDDMAERSLLLAKWLDCTARAMQSTVLAKRQEQVNCDRRDWMSPILINLTTY